MSEDNSEHHGFSVEPTRVVRNRQNEGGLFDRGPDILIAVT